MAWVNQIEGDFQLTTLFGKYTELVGLTIKGVRYDDACWIEFTDGALLEIRDDGQSCCESRYMTCDDDLSGFAGGAVVGIDLNAAGMGVHDPKPPEEETSWSEYHEEQFVCVTTTKGSFTLCTHNEHNGYYGGFDLTVKFHR